MTAPISGYQFREHTNIGSGANSQGTLFGVTRPRTAVGPKGFSPARQDDVRQMLRRAPDEDPRFSPETNISVRSLPGSPVEYEPSGRLTPKGEGQVQAHRRKIQDMVSRSTAEIHPEERTRIIVHGPDEPIGMRGGPNERVAGLYEHAAYGNPHTIRVVDDAVASTQPGRLGGSPTLTHEMGHRDSYIRGTDSAKYDTPERRGQEEAFADDFALQHTRGFGGMKMGFVRAYPTGNRGNQFRESYDATRTTPVKPPAAKPGWVTPEHVLGQHPMLERIPDGNTEGHTWDYSHESGVPARTKMGAVAQGIISNPISAPPVWR